MAPPAIDTQGSYDRVAEEYAALLYAELDHKPLDRALLDAFAAARSAMSAAGRGRSRATCTAASSRSWGSISRTG